MARLPTVETCTAKAVSVRDKKKGISDTEVTVNFGSNDNQIQPNVAPITSKSSLLRKLKVNVFRVILIDHRKPSIRFP